MPTIEPGSDLDQVLEWAVENYPHPVIDALRERDALRARVAELAAQNQRLRERDMQNSHALLEAEKREDTLCRLLRRARPHVKAPRGTLENEIAEALKG